MADPSSGADPDAKAGVSEPGGEQEQNQVQELDQGVPIDPRDVASAGRSCSVILILGVAIILALCVGIVLRWAVLG